MDSDFKLPRDYLDQGSEISFARLVERHMKLVYGVCRRDIDDAQIAQDASQAVFLLLAQKGGRLKKDASIASWLFTTARLVSRNAVRAERRRRLMEREAVRMAEHDHAPGPAWTDLEPVLNDALGRLGDADREAVILRYVDGLSLRETAERTGVNESAVSKRATRALDKMRQFLERHGVAITTTGLATLLTLHPQAPDKATAAVYSTIHSAASGTSGAHLAVLQKGVFTTMQAIRYKFALSVATSVVAVSVGAVPVAMVRAWDKTHASFRIQDAPASAPLPAMSGTQVVAQSKAALANLSSLQATVVSHSSTGASAVLTSQSTIVYASPGQIRVDSTAMSASNTGAPLAMDCDGSSTWVQLAGKWTRQQSAGLGVATLTGATGYSGSTLPALLLNITWGNPYTGSPAPQAEARELGGRAVYRVQFPAAGTTAWIDGQTFLPVAVAVAHTGIQSEQTITYTATNQSVSPTVFAQPAGAP